MMRQHILSQMTKDATMVCFRSNVSSTMYRCGKEDSCTPDRNCHTFCLGDKIASHPGVLTQAKKNTQNLEINQISGVVVQEKESNMVFCSRWKFPILGMTEHGHPLGWKLPSRTEPHIRFLYGTQWYSW